MEGLHRRLAAAAVVLPFLLAGAGVARAAVIMVNTTDGGSQPAPLCTLQDAVTAHNTQTAINGCPAGSINDVIKFMVTGTISIDEPLEVANHTLEILGPGDGCSGAEPCGITIDGGGTVQILIADGGTVVTLSALTLTHGFALTTVPGTGGGAVFAGGIVMEIRDCLLVDNTAAGSTPTLGGEGGAVFGSTGTIEITNTTIANNTAVHGTTINSFGGGLIWVNGNGALVENSTIVGNSADEGGGTSDDVGPVLKGTILADNTGGNCFDVSPTDENYNLSDDSSCFFSKPLSKNGATAVELALASTTPKNNGGPTDTIALDPGSIAIGRIPVADCTDLSNIPLRTDQRLFARPDPLDLTTCDSGAFEFDGEKPIAINLETERVQIARSMTPNSDQVNMSFFFTDDGPGTTALCDASTDALNGIVVDLFGGTCADLPNIGLELNLSPFVVHTINHQSYGTLSQQEPAVTLQQPSETVLARIVEQTTPADSCGAWSLNVHVAGLTTSGLGLGGSGPFALTVTDNAGNTGCLDVTNAVVGNQLDPPRKVRRGARRGRR